PGVSGSPAATASPSPSFVASDQSAKVLSAQLPAVKGSARGTVGNQPVTMNVADVKATSSGTLLTYWFTGTEALLAGQSEKAWENLPTLVDPAGKKSYEPFTFTHARGETYCLCTDAAAVLGVAQPRTIFYPALPATATTVEVRQAGVADAITVTVTR
ncbi:MAG: hypothetical protein WAR57_03445, partial [Candidatus Phosphoribacter sp.]